MPEAASVTPAVIEAARKEGKIAFYSALELNISEKLARTFEAKYPGIAARVERSGAEHLPAHRVKSRRATSPRST